MTKRVLSNRLFYQTAFVFISVLYLYGNLLSQSFVVQGKVTSSRFMVQNAKITFIDNADTTIRYSTQTDATGYYEIGLTTSIENEGKSLPTSFKLAQSYPNPFSTSTVIPYKLEKESDGPVNHL